MPSLFTFANNISTTLAASISSGATSLTLSSAANLPSSIPAGKVLVITLNDTATRQQFEVIYATAISGATLSGLLRGQENTSAQAWSTGAYAYCSPTMGQMQAFGQLADNNTWSGNNTFANPVTIPDGTAPNHAASVEQLSGRKWVVTATGNLTVPAGVTAMYLSGCAPGGGGAAGGPGSIGASPAWAGGGGGGGAGQSLQRALYSVTPGQQINVTIGSPGVGGVVSGNNPGNNGTSGGNLVISGPGFNNGTEVTLQGGGGGNGGNAVTSGNAVGGGPGIGFPAGGYGNDTTNGNAGGSGGAGASGPFGGGGGAARGSTFGGVAGGNASGYGAGGGGGSGVYTSGAGNGGSGGNGSPGLMIFEW
ncbi:TPA: hypothetical protein QDC51_001047 [Burkholderia multivorans]|nr:hypothetical protein [Burkholderia multivorans]HDR9840177.1 hypothetical protein [Burkholderia multivorans]HDR9846765.1 hypothetical protein [Burkholderia multivorans]HDR9853175.1 hypothetical protein [Burkholderia multivorans]